MLNHWQYWRRFTKQTPPQFWFQLPLTGHTHLSRKGVWHSEVWCIDDMLLAQNMEKSKATKMWHREKVSISQDEPALAYSMCHWYIWCIFCPSCLCRLNLRWLIKLPHCLYWCIFTKFYSIRAAGWCSQTTDGTDVSTLVTECYVHAEPQLFTTMGAGFYFHFLLNGKKRKRTEPNTYLLVKMYSY